MTILLLQNHVRETIRLSMGMLNATPHDDDNCVIGSDMTREAHSEFDHAVGNIIEDLIVNPNSPIDWLFLKPGLSEEKILEHIGIVARAADHLERCTALDAKILEELNGMMTVLAEDAPIFTADELGFSEGDTAKS